MPFAHLLIAALFSAGAAAQSLSGFGQVRLRLSEGTNSEPRIQINDAVIRLPSSGSAEHAGIHLAATPDGLEVRTSSQALVIDGTSLGGWSLEAPARTTASLMANLGARIFRFGSADTNPGTLRLILPDKGSAELRAGASAMLDIFEGNTYSLRAGTNVTATTAEGQRGPLSRLHPPLLGGELARLIDARGGARFQRASPAVQIEIAGSLDGTVQIKTAEIDLALIPNQEKQLSFANGTKLWLRHALERQIVEWRVVKGVCQFKIAGFSCWKSTATTGQSGGLQWNSIRKIIDLSHGGRGDAEPIFVQLSGRVHASIGPGGTFQYAQFQDCGSFTTSAAGGEVHLVDRESGEVTPVINGISFSEGERVGGGRVELPLHTISFGWQSESRVELRTTAGLTLIDLGREETLRLGADEIFVAFGADGNVTFRSLHGNFQLHPAFIPNFTLDLPEGTALVGSLDHRRHIFTAQAAPDSAGSIRVVAAGLTYMYLSGAAKINVMVGQNTFIPETAAAWIFFEGAGGESTFTSGLQPAPLIRPDRFDASRIFQQPVSVIE